MIDCISSSDFTYDHGQQNGLQLARQKRFYYRWNRNLGELLSQIMIARLGKGDVKVEHIGTRPGEKIHELLVSRDECKRTRSHGALWVVLPYFAPANLVEQYVSAPVVEFSEYSSRTSPHFSYRELEALLEAESFLSSYSHSPHTSLYFKKSSFEFH